MIKYGITLFIQSMMKVWEWISNFIRDISAHDIPDHNIPHVYYAHDISDVSPGKVDVLCFLIGTVFICYMSVSFIWKDSSTSLLIYYYCDLFSLYWPENTTNMPVDQVSWSHSKLFKEMALNLQNIILTYFGHYNFIQTIQSYKQKFQ